MHIIKNQHGRIDIFELLVWIFIIGVLSGGFTIVSDWFDDNAPETKKEIIQATATFKASLNLNGKVEGTPQPSIEPQPSAELGVIDATIKKQAPTDIDTSIIFVEMEQL